MTRSDRYDRLDLGVKGESLRVDMLELGIAVRTIARYCVASTLSLIHNTVIASLLGMRVAETLCPIARRTETGRKRLGRREEPPPSLVEARTKSMVTCPNRHLVSHDSC
jgi:hypothetical protein